MVTPLDGVGRWTLVVFTDDADQLETMEDWSGRFRSIRFVAMRTAPAEAAPSGLELVDRGGRLAADLGVVSGQAVMIDARGTVTQTWARPPEEEALSLYAGRPATPSAVPAWLFPLLAAVVILAGVGAWAATRAPATPVPSAAVAAPPPAAPTALPVAEPPSEVEVTDEVEPTVDVGSEVVPAAGRGPRKGGRAAKAQPGGWALTPRKQAAQIGSFEGGTLTITGLPDSPVSACRAAFPITGPITVSAEWTYEGFSKSPVRALLRRIDANGDAIRGPDGRVVLARGRGSSDWTTFSAQVSPTDAAPQGRICLEVDAGGGKLSIRNLSPGG